MSQVHVRKKLGGNAVKSNEILKKIRAPATGRKGNGPDLCFVQHKEKYKT